MAGVPVVRWMAQVVERDGRDVVETRRFDCVLTAKRLTFTEMTLWLGCRTFIDVDEAAAKCFATEAEALDALHDRLCMAISHLMQQAASEQRKADLVSARLVARRGGSGGDGAAS